MNAEGITAVALAFLAGEDTARNALVMIQSGNADPDALYIALRRLPADHLRGFARIVRKHIERAGGAA